MEGRGEHAMSDMPTKPTKLMTMAEAIERFVPDGASVAVRAAFWLPAAWASCSASASRLPAMPRRRASGSVAT